MQMTSIIIPNLNGHKLLEQCVNLIKQHTTTPFEIIVVDNGSTDGSLSYCIQNEIKCISLPWNRGFHRACSMGISIALGDALLLLNNDMIVSPHWLNNLLCCLYSSEEIGIVGPFTNYASGTQQVEVPYEKPEAMHEDMSSPDHTKWEEVQQLISSCILFKREVLNQIGWLEGPYSQEHNGDGDICNRTRLAGYRLMIAGDVFVSRHGIQEGVDPLVS